MTRWQVVGRTVFAEGGLLAVLGVGASVDLLIPGASSPDDTEGSWSQTAWICAGLVATGVLLLWAATARGREVPAGVRGTRPLGVTIGGILELLLAGGLVVGSVIFVALDPTAASAVSATVLVAVALALAALGRELLRNGPSAGLTTWSPARRRRSCHE